MLRLFVFVMVFFSIAITEKYTIPIFVILAIIPLSSFTGSLAALVDSFFAVEPFVRLLLILEGAEDLKSLQGNNSGCSHSDMDPHDCELYQNGGHLFMTQCADIKLIVRYNFLSCGE